MQKKYVFYFLLTMVLTSLLAQGILNYHQKKLSDQYTQEIKIIQSDVEERFRLLIESPLAIGVVSAEYFSAGPMNEKSYQQLATNVLSNFDEILGLNVLNSEGKITKVFPHKDNFPGLGKISQNYPYFLASLKRDEPYWMSPPFKLYQGPEGFTFYIPIHHKGNLFGWVAPVISVDRFFKKFIKSDFLETYHLIIEDEETHRSYFKTSDLPEGKSEIKVHTNQVHIKGRELNFISWRKHLDLMPSNWIFSGLIGFFISMSIVFILSLFEQRKLVKDQLSDIESLLKLTVSDASGSFNTISGQLNLMQIGAAPISIDRISKHVNYIQTLLEQMKILQNIAESVDLSKQGRTALLPLFLELSEVWNEKLKEKDLLLHYNPEQLANIRVNGNKWLLCHSVFGNIIAHTITNSAEGTNIDIGYSKDNSYHCISFHNKKAHDSKKHIELETQGLNIVRKVIDLHKGKLQIEYGEAGEEIITVKLSASV